MDKKGEIVSGTVISFILLIFGLAIILFIFFQIPWQQNIDSQVCHQSVVVRATAEELVPIKGTGSFVPLKCKTEKICVGAGKKFTCNEFGNAKGVTNYEVDEKIDIEKVIADETLECWQTMGEGKLSLFNDVVANNFAGKWVYPSCVICSRIAFDKKSLDISNVDDLKDLEEKIDIYDYMKIHVAPGQEISYLDYFNLEQGNIKVSENSYNVNTLKAEIDKVLDIEGFRDNTQMVNDPLKTLDSDNTQDKYNELAVVFIQVNPPKYGESLRNIAVGGLGITAVGGFLTNGVAFKAVGEVLTQPVTWVIAGIGLAVHGTSVLASKQIAIGECGDITLKGDAQYGCSAVRVLDYDANALTKHCGYIESIS